MLIKLHNEPPVPIELMRWYLTLINFLPERQFNRILLINITLPLGARVKHKGSEGADNISGYYIIKLYGSYVGDGPHFCGG